MPSARRTVALAAALVAVALGALVLAGVLPLERRDDAPPPEAKGSERGRRTKRPAPPAAKACLPPPTDAGPDGMVASAGLDPDAVRATMRGAVQGALGCFADAPATTLLLSIRVACTGRVAAVVVDDDGGASPEVQRCVRDALGRASFPAHALPDGDTFQYPLAYTPPG